jgi:gamma-glutamyltranspeptidase/glutathione hydrolase
VATGFALAVTLPRAGNLGGGGFMVVSIKASKEDPGALMAIDFRGEAPALANRYFYRKEGQVDRQLTKAGHTASTVPGTVSGLYSAHQRWGKLPWATLLKPAITLATDGIAMSHDLAWALNAKSLQLSLNPEACEIYFSGCTGYAKEGTLLKQPDLAKSLKLIATLGADAFYRGPISARIAADMKEHGGLIQAADLAAYQARILPPIATSYHGYYIASMPPPAGGLPLLQTLNIMEHFPLSDYGPGSSETIHVLAEAMKRAFAYRFTYLADPHFNNVPVTEILDKSFAKTLAGQIRMNRMTPVEEIAPYLPEGLPTGPDTTHLSVLDSQGNGVVLTYTLSSSFGSGVVIKDTGILMNNQMNNYAYKPELPDTEYKALANSLQPGKRPKSTQAPTLVFQDGNLVLLTGSPGGRRIITTVAQLISNVIDHKMNIAEATVFPRIHQGWTSDTLEHEPGVSKDTLDNLFKLGYELKLGASMGSTQSIRIEKGKISGAADPRRPGAKAVSL